MTPRSARCIDEMGGGARHEGQHREVEGAVHDRVLDQAQRAHEDGHGQEAGPEHPHDGGPAHGDPPRAVEGHGGEGQRA